MCVCRDQPKINTLILCLDTMKIEFLTFFKLLKCLPTLLAYLIRRANRQQTKEAILTEFYKGISIEDLNFLGEEYGTKILPTRLRPEALAVKIAGIHAGQIVQMSISEAFAWCDTVPERLTKQKNLLRL